MKLADDIRAARRVYLIGNGGSYANAVHIANDLLAAGVKAYTLDPASLTASANDYGYAHVFARWLEVVAEEGDLLIALSGSGNSVNILNALDTAKKKGMKSIAIVGDYSRGLATKVADRAICLGSTMQAAEEQQLYLGHQAMLELRACA